MKSRLYRIAVCLVLGLSMIGCAGPQEEIIAETQPRELRPVDLNRTLTNEMSQLDSLDMAVEAFMNKWSIRGISLSVTRHDSLLYSRGYGYADLDEPVTPGTIFRVASVSKLLTAAGIMKLCESGRLSLDDRVFGSEGLLNEFDADIIDSRCRSITVEDLLRHQGGFSSKMGGDPMFSTLRLMRANSLDEAPDHDELVRIMLRRKLAFFPGTAGEYSNFGYLLLSMIIEKITGQDYEYWMKENLLEPAHCHDMHIGYNYYAQKFPNETRYFMQRYDRDVPEYNNSGRSVQRCYGGNDIRALSGAGAWVCSSPELARFVASIDNSPIVPEVISPESVREMTMWYDNNTYSLGWNDTNPRRGWQRTGALSGTNALIRYFPDGECWILITNTNVFLGSKFSRYTTQLVRQCRERYSAMLPLRNLFYE